jgi:hypothetical protein
MAATQNKSGELGTVAQRRRGSPLFVVAGKREKTFEIRGGKAMKFVQAVEEILVTEHMRSREEASELTKIFPNIMAAAMMAGHGREYRAAAIALEMAESDAKRCSSPLPLPLE